MDVKDILMYYWGKVGLFNTQCCGDKLDIKGKKRNWLHSIPHTQKPSPSDLKIQG